MNYYFKIEIDDCEVIETRMLVEAAIIINTALYMHWSEQPDEGDGPRGYYHAKKQADDMITQTIQNGLNLNADGVSVQCIS